MPRFRMLPPHGWKLPGKGEFHIPLSKHIDRPRRPAAQSGGGCAEQGRALLSPVEGRVAGAACEARGLGRARRRPARRVCVHHRSPSVVESGTSGHCVPTQGLRELPRRPQVPCGGPCVRGVMVVTPWSARLSPREAPRTSRPWCNQRGGPPLLPLPRPVLPPRHTEWRGRQRLLRRGPCSRRGFLHKTTRRALTLHLDKDTMKRVTSHHSTGARPGWV